MDLVSLSPIASCLDLQGSFISWTEGLTEGHLQSFLKVGLSRRFPQDITEPKGVTTLHIMTGTNDSVFLDNRCTPPRGTKTPPGGKPKHPKLRKVSSRGTKTPPMGDIKCTQMNGDSFMDSPWTGLFGQYLRALKAAGRTLPRLREKYRINPGKADTLPG
jgi:hypothetical protein